ncbi:MAG TPA: NAD(P)H-dependent glycerol-3-phosphate dehydrogenase [Longimicrobium sp.]|jgi:glycerol-3-phosphate dehydrogenase (NAD(P)+)|uniref:NAD(P)H-dependent glycerol-3-phosphate dehydrogenase n=1 Tax=Longimicrobium sp. TaxID=2029185 RepID=UPI002EDB3893
MTSRAAVVGAGSWGTALANLLAGKGIDTVVWSFEPDVADAINHGHANSKYLDGISLAPSLRATTDMAEAMRGADLVLSVSPSHVVRQVMAQAAPHMADGVLLVSASKGIENESLMTMDGVLADVLPPSVSDSACFLSGPSFALEVGKGFPTAVTIASKNQDAANRAQAAFQTSVFRVYTSSDVAGVELGGSVKNVIAIAAGVVEGMGFGFNTQAALITRGLAEITRLGQAMGADPRTLAGLAGIGDLMLTCMGGLSRNRTVGVELGRGRSLDDILGGMVMVAEGVRTARSARDLAHRTGVEMPIVEAVHDMLFAGLDPRRAVEQLMLREPKAEHWG